MKTNIYRISYSWYEEWSFTDFTHPENKTQEEFQNDVKAIAQKYIKNHVKNGGSTEDRNFKSWIGCGTIVQMIADKLPELGYIEFNDNYNIVNFNIWGSGITDSDEDAEDLKKILDTEQIKSVIEYNFELANK